MARSRAIAPDEQEHERSWVPRRPQCADNAIVCRSSAHALAARPMQPCAAAPSVRSHGSRSGSQGRPEALLLTADANAEDPLTDVMFHPSSR
jgi:hypothetical protein